MSETDVFAAISHPTRRGILRRLATGGPATLTDLAGGFPESRQAVRKHIRVLTHADLIRLERSGREQHCILQARRLAEIQQWLTLFEQFWDDKLSRLKIFVESTPPSAPPHEDSMPKKRSGSQNASKSQRKTPKVSAVKGKTVAWYIGTLEAWQAEIVRELDALIQSAVPRATSSIKWAQPVYESDGPFCFIKAAKKHVTFGFWRGVELDDEQKLLEGSGDKMRHIKLAGPGDVRKTLFKKMIKQAAKLNQQHGDPSR